MEDNCLNGYRNRIFRLGRSNHFITNIHRLVPGGPTAGDSYYIYTLSVGFLEDQFDHGMKKDFRLNELVKWWGFLLV